MSSSKTIFHIQIKIKVPNPSQEPLKTSNPPNQDLKDIDVLCTLKIKKESQNLEPELIKHHLPYKNQDQNAKPK